MSEGRDEQGRYVNLPGPGRPRELEFDPKELHKLGQLNATYQEVASWFGCSSSWIDKNMADTTTLYEFTHPATLKTKQMTFRQILESGKDAGKITLRRQQMKACEDGNPTMLIWMGKQNLGQRDNLDLKHGGTGPGGSILVGDAASAKAALLAGSVPTSTTGGTEETS